MQFKNFKTKKPTALCAAGLSVYKKLLCTPNRFTANRAITRKVIAKIIIVCSCERTVQHDFPPMEKICLQYTRIRCVCQGPRCLKQGRPPQMRGLITKSADGVPFLALRKEPKNARGASARLKKSNFKFRIKFNFSLTPRSEAPWNPHRQIRTDFSGSPCRRSPPFCLWQNRAGGLKVFQTFMASPPPSHLTVRQ